ncbi:hypothetical protein WH96_17140 [Kiloniella spongiae]|uniref:Uncharacterized protein n=1 Tax=Kiloniella spongiae TaxID=1489064 RepID=A0A0H2MSH3_9PROT|nr:hypothetical protein [Kiloniella spongiae]KLN59590.1 hypothetical protein WH96_17140 [Kiloniella spongiae]
MTQVLCFKAKGYKIDATQSLNGTFAAGLIEDKETFWCVNAGPEFNYIYNDQCNFRHSSMVD